jgi:hypothetical protein
MEELILKPQEEIFYKRCPKCSSKLKRKKVKQKGNILFQKMICKKCKIIYKYHFRI